MSKRPRLNLTGPFARLRLRVQLVVLLAALPMLGWVLFRANEDRRLAAEAAQTSALQAIELVANTHANFILQTRQTLAHLAELPEARQGRPPVCQALFPELQTAYERFYPRYLNVGAMSAEGQVYCSVTPLPSGVQVSQTLYFQEAQRTLNFAVGEYQLDPATGETLSTVAYPVLDSGGEVRVLLFVIIDLGWIDDTAPLTLLPRGSAVTLLNQHGLILDRFPEDLRWVGQTLPEAPLLQALTGQGGVGAAVAEDLDGTTHQFVFLPIKSAAAHQTYLALGIPLAAVVAEVDAQQTNSLLGVGGMVLILLTVTWFATEILVLRRVRPLVNAAQRLSAGDLSARTGVTYDEGELGQLARAFDDMSHNLEKREAERQAAVEAMRRARDELEEALQEISDFSYTVSHDLRAPLRGLNGYAHILIEDYGAMLPLEGQAHLQKIKHSATLMGQLIDNLLEFMRLNRQPLAKRRVSMAQLVRAVYTELTALPNARPIDFLLAELPPCHVDPLLMEQVWKQLLANALKFTRARAATRIEVGWLASETAEDIYYVADNGIGFDMRYTDKLFKVFHRLHTVEEFDGAGVGLAIVQRIVHRHGGRVWAEGALDTGARFYFSIPRGE